MLRITLLWMLIAALAVYAWRDWFISLCGLIVLMAVLEHPDMPKTMFGVQGLNPWNILMGIILLSWALTRGREGLRWDLPWSVAAMLLAYLAVVSVGFVRMAMDRRALEPCTTAGLVSEFFINTVKFVLPGLLLFDGCRTHRRLMIALLSMLAMYLVLAIQVIKWMPPEAAVHGDTLRERSLKIIQNEIGYSRVNMSRMLSGASWAMLAMLPLAPRRRARWLVIGAFLVTAYGQALTGGRMGYATWGVVGFVMCLVRWRRYLVLLAGVPVLLALLFPGFREAFSQGFGTDSRRGAVVIDEYELTSGRNLAWPYVVDEIKKSPLLGYGRQAMVRTGLAAKMWWEMQEAFPHPHNAYLEWMLDNGLVGTVLVLPFYAAALAGSVQLFRRRDSRQCAAVGGVTFALLLALLVAGIGSQTFYPREGDLGLWCAMGLMLRVWMERSRAEKLREGLGVPLRIGQTRGKERIAVRSVSGAAR